MSGELTDAARMTLAYLRGADAWRVVEDTDELLEEINENVAARWARLLRKYFGTRRQQLIFSSTGQALQWATKDARDRVSRTYGNVR